MMKIVHAFCQVVSKLLNKPRVYDENEITKRCYRLFHFVAEKTKLMSEYTEGYYKDGQNTPYELAQEYQIEEILDKVKCGKETQLLEVGCGNGGLLRAAKKRGARAVGITVCKEQVEHLRKEGLEVYLCDVRELEKQFNSELFDAIVCNGSIEHYVKNKDALEGKDDLIYKSIFKKFSSVLKPGGLAMTTTIHMKERKLNNYIASNLGDHKYLSHNWRLAVLIQFYGGWYPSEGQLERCSEPNFKKIYEYDATKDYLYTSLDWKRRFLRGMLNPINLYHMFCGVVDSLTKDPYFAYIALVYFKSGTWTWQFEGENPPVKHLWKVWEKVST